jgi:hypothetical protein
MFDFLQNEAGHFDRLRDIFQMSNPAPSVSISHVKKALAGTTNKNTTDKDIFVCCLCLSCWYAFCRLEARLSTINTKTILTQYANPRGAKHSALARTLHIIIEPLIDTLDRPTEHLKRRISLILTKKLIDHIRAQWATLASVKNPLYAFFQEEVYSPPSAPKCAANIPTPVLKSPEVLNYEDNTTIDQIRSSLTTNLNVNEMIWSISNQTTKRTREWRAGLRVQMYVETRQRK